MFSQKNSNRAFPCWTCFILIPSMNKILMVKLISNYSMKGMTLYPPPVFARSIALSSKYACITRATIGAATEPPSPPL